MKCKRALAVQVIRFGVLKTTMSYPDVVVMAKGIGNGCPLAAVVTTKEIAQ